MTDSEKLDLLLQKTSTLENNMLVLKEDMKEMETSLRQDMKEMKEDISSLREEVHLTLENEITPNINIIAEGHLELSRKLNECIHISSDIKAKQEILDVFINMQKTNNRLKALG